jgi:hypothetical protein
VVWYGALRLQRRSEDPPSRTRAKAWVVMVAVISDVKGTQLSPFLQ